MSWIDITSIKHDGMQEDWTDSFREAVEQLERNGGGTLYVPSGTYVTGPILLKSNIILYLETGATLLFDNCMKKYPLIQAAYAGKMMSMHQPLIYAKNAHNIAIKGNGSLDGQGNVWWEKYLDFRKKKIQRPHMIYLENCTNVEIQGIKCLNSPAWTIHPFRCKDVRVEGVTIQNPWDSPNTDGINPNSSKNVKILNCTIHSGDDCIAIKAGTEDSQEKISCENIQISNCMMLRGHGGVVIGSEMSGTVRNVMISDCLFRGTDRGIRLKTRRNRGGSIERISVSHIMMEQVISPFVCNMFYHCGERGKEKYVWDKEKYPIDETTPCIKDIFLSDITAYDVQAAAGFVYGLPEMPVQNVRINNCEIYMDEQADVAYPAMMDQLEPMAQKGFYMRNAVNVELNHVKLYGVKGKLWDRTETVQ